MIDQLIPIIASGLFAGGLVAIVQSIANRRKTHAEAGKTSAEGEKAEAEATDIITHTVTDFMAKAMEHSEQREKQLLTEIKKLEIKVDNLQVTVNALSDQLRSNGIEPVYPPMPNFG